MTDVWLDAKGLQSFVGFIYVVFHDYVCMYDVLRTHMLQISRIRRSSRVPSRVIPNHPISRPYLTLYATFPREPIPAGMYGVVSSQWDQSRTSPSTSPFTKTTTRLSFLALVRPYKQAVQENEENACQPKRGQNALASLHRLEP